MKKFVTFLSVLLLGFAAFAQEPVKTILLNGSERRIALYENGSWAWLEADGTKTAPAEGEKVILAQDGSWAVIGECGVELPDIQKSWDVVKAKNINTQIPNGGPQRLNSGTSASSGSTASASSSGSTQYYTIKSGDTLSGIAAKHHTTVAKLCQLNGIKTTTTLQIGKKLKVK